MSHTTYQIVLIKCKDSSLYGELIQMMKDRSTVWIRPLALCIENLEHDDCTIFDVRNGPDIICPEYLHQLALDEDWLQLLSKINEHPKNCDFTQANKHLRQFLKAILQPQVNR